MNYFKQCIQEQIDRDRVRCAEHGWSFRERSADAAFSHGDFIRAVLGIDNPEDARRFRDGYLEVMTANGVTPERQQELASSNIGWCYGEGMPSERIAMWVEATQASHPVFGTMLVRPTAEEALEAGKRLGEQSV